MLATTIQQTSEQTSEQTAQAANTLSGIRKIRIEEARATDQDDKQLRKIINPNRCQTMNVHYFADPTPFGRLDGIRNVQSAADKTTAG